MCQGGSLATRGTCNTNVYTECVDFDWDDAVVVDRSRRIDGERRQAAIGDLRGRICTLIFTDRREEVRIISFRRSNRAEERVYEKVRATKS